MKEKISRFMYGRYGNDQLNRFLNIVALILIVISFVTGSALVYIALAVELITLFRMFSRDSYRRSSENTKYLQMTQKIRNKTSRISRDMSIRKTHHIYACPQCKQRIKVPRGKGRIAVRCPKCSNEFIKRS